LGHRYYENKSDWYVENKILMLIPNIGLMNLEIELQVEIDNLRGNRKASE